MGWCGNEATQRRVTERSSYHLEGRKGKGRGDNWEQGLLCRSRDPGEMQSLQGAFLKPGDKGDIF